MTNKKVKFLYTYFWLRINFIQLSRRVLPEFSTTADGCQFSTTGEGAFHLGLKVLFTEMDPAEIKFIRKAFIKERSAEVFRKIRPSLIL
jgi:hypothetical protein